MKNFTIINNSGIKSLSVIPFKYSKFLTQSERIVLSYILMRSGLKKWTLKQSDISQNTGLSLRTIERVMTNFREMMILNIVRLEKSKYLYQLILPSIEDLEKLKVTRHHDGLVTRQIDGQLPDTMTGSYPTQCRYVPDTMTGSSTAENQSISNFDGSPSLYIEKDIENIYIEKKEKANTSSSIIENEKRIYLNSTSEKKPTTEPPPQPPKKLDQIDPLNSLDIQERLIEFGRLFGFPFLNVTNTEKLVRINSKETLNYWLDNISYLTKALVSLKKENTDGAKYVGVSFINSVKTQKPLSKKYSPEIEDCITFNLKSKEEDADLLKWKSILIKFNLPVNLTQKTDSFLRLCENILTYTKNVEILRKNEVYYKRIENLLTEFSITDIENLFNEIYFENKYKMPVNYLKKFSGEVKPCIENLDLLSSLVKN